MFLISHLHLFSLFCLVCFILCFTLLFQTILSIQLHQQTLELLVYGLFLFLDSQTGVFFKLILSNFEPLALIRFIYGVSIQAQLLFVFWVVHSNVVETHYHNNKPTTLFLEMDRSLQNLKAKYGTEYSTLVMALKQPFNILKWLIAFMKLVILNLKTVYFVTLLMVFVFSFLLIEKVLKNTLITSLLCALGLLTKSPIVIILFVMTVCCMLLLWLNWMVCKAAPSYHRSIYAFLEKSSVEFLVGLQSQYL